ncbi:hypothetical protein DXK94_18705 [Arthrobacter sp. RT-1]|nr:hypothetical protein DXK94_18705 [Arthrobacter sp. RT-1]
MGGSTTTAGTSTGGSTTGVTAGGSTTGGCSTTIGGTTTGGKTGGTTTGGTTTAAATQPPAWIAIPAASQFCPPHRCSLGGMMSSPWRSWPWSPESSMLLEV